MNRFLLLSAAAVPLLADASVKGAALLALAGLCVLLMRRSSAAARHMVWLAAVVALLVLPLLAFLLPGWRVLPQWVAPGAAAAGASRPHQPYTAYASYASYAAHEADTPPSSMEQRTVLPPAPPLPAPANLPAAEPRPIPQPAPLPAAPATAAAPLTAWLLPLWAAGCAVLLFRLAAAHFLLRRNTRRCEPATGPLAAAFEAVREECGVRQPVRVLLDNARTIPVVWGVFRPQLLLPGESANWDATRLRSVLLHELAHLRRRDPLTQLLTQLACALHWFNPLVWLAAWRLHVERERACDDLVLSRGVKPSAYAEHLLHIATQLSPARWTQACGLAMARKSSIEGRLVAVLSDKLNRRSVTRTLAAAAILLSTAIAVPVAMLRAGEEKSAESFPDEAKKAEAAKGANKTGSSGVFVIEDEALELPKSGPGPRQSARLKPATEEKLAWGKEVNGLRAALVPLRPQHELKQGTVVDLNLVVQNVSDAPVKLRGGSPVLTASLACVLPGGTEVEVLQNIVDVLSTIDEFTLQPREVGVMSLMSVCIGELDANAKSAHGRPVGYSTGKVVRVLRGFTGSVSFGSPGEGFWKGTLLLGRLTMTPVGLRTDGATSPAPEEKAGDAKPTPVQPITDGKSSALVLRADGQEPVVIITGRALTASPDATNRAGTVTMAVATTAETQKIRYTWPEDAPGFLDLELGGRGVFRFDLSRGRVFFVHFEKMEFSADVFQVPADVKVPAITSPETLTQAATAVNGWYDAADDRARWECSRVVVAEREYKAGQPLDAAAEKIVWGEANEAGLRLGLGGLENGASYPVGQELPVKQYIRNDSTKTLTFSPTQVFNEGMSGELIRAADGRKFLHQRGYPHQGFFDRFKLAPGHYIALGSGPLSTIREDSGVTIGMMSHGFTVPPGDYTLQLTHGIGQFVGRPANFNFGDPRGAPGLGEWTGVLTSAKVPLRLEEEQIKTAKAGDSVAFGTRYTITFDKGVLKLRHYNGYPKMSLAGAPWEPQSRDWKIPAADGEYVAAWAVGGQGLWIKDATSITHLIVKDVLTENGKWTPEQAAGEIKSMPAGVRTALQLPAVRTAAAEPGPAPEALQSSGAQPKHEYARTLFKNWQASARSDGKIPGALIGQLAEKVDQFTKQYPKDDATPKFAALRPKLDASRDWVQAELVAVLDEITALSTAPVGWANLPMEFDAGRNVQPGKPLPKALESAAWGQPAENGLRAAWLLEPAPNVVWPSIAEFQYPLGTVLKSRVLFHNTGKVPVVFQTETWHQYDGHSARDAKGNEIKIGGTRYTGITPMATFRLAPGEYCEVSGHGIAIGAGEYTEERSIGAVGAIIEAKVGDTVTLSHTVDAAQGGWTKPNDPKDPAELRKKIIAERVNREAPLPTAAADRELLLRRVTLDLTGVPPTPEEIATFTSDKAPDAMANLIARLQAGPAAELPWKGKLPTGETTFRVIAADPDAAKKPRTATAPGRYVLGDGVHLQVRHVTEDGKRTNSAEILFFGPDPKKESPHKPHAIALRGGDGSYSFVWERGSGVLWLLETEMRSINTVFLYAYATKFDFTNPADVRVTKQDAKDPDYAEWTRFLPKHLHEPFLKPFREAQNILPVGTAREDQQEKPAAVKDGAKPEVSHPLDDEALDLPRPGPGPRQCGRLKPGTEEKLAWGEPVNGLRAALVRVPPYTEIAYGTVMDLNVVVQNVSDKPVKFRGGSPVAGAAVRVELAGNTSVEVNQNIVDMLSSIDEFTIQPREVAVMSLMSVFIGEAEANMRSADPNRAVGYSTGRLPKPSEVVAGFSATLSFEHGPAGFWKGSLWTRTMSVKPTDKARSGSPGTTPSGTAGSEAPAGTADATFDWGEAVNGMRGAVVIRSPKPGAAPGIFLALQNVSDREINFDDRLAGDQQRALYVSSSGRILFSLSSGDPRTQLVFPPGDIDFLPIFPPGRQKEEAVFIEGLRKDSLQTWRVELNIETAPENAWKGQLATGESRCISVEGAQPKTPEGRALFKAWLDHARLNGDIPGGLIALLHDKVKEFIRNNEPDASGGPYAQKMKPLEPRFGELRDWKAADVVALLDGIAAASTIPLETTLEHLTRNTLQGGAALPPAYADADWGEPLQGGLRMAYVLEPRAEAYHLGTEIRARIILHNSGSEPVTFVTTGFQQPGHSAKRADGSGLGIDSTFWSTLGRKECYRLAPGEYCELHTPGLGIGAEDKSSDDWANVRAGSWIQCAPGDEVIFTPGAAMLYLENQGEPNADWWLDFITERLNREAPVPAERKEREYLLYRVVRELYGAAPSTTEGDAFAADTSPDALKNLAALLVKHPYGQRSQGTIRAGSTRFRVLPPDADAAGRPRVATGPGWYSLSDSVKLSVTRQAAGSSVKNEASIIYFREGKDNVVRKIPLPSGHGTWAAATMKGAQELWVAEAGSVRKYDFTNPLQPVETRYKAGEAPLAKALRGALDPVLSKPAADTPKAKEPSPPPAAEPGAPGTEHPKTSSVEQRRRVDWSKPPPMSFFEGKYDPELLARPAAKPEKLNEDSESGTKLWPLAEQILRAAVEQDPQFRHLLTDGNLKAADIDNRILTMSLAAYDYSVFGNRDALKVILDQLGSTHPEAYLATFPLGFLDEWAQSIPAVEKVFAQRDGAKGEEYHRFWAHREWLFPQSFAAFQQTQIAANKLDAASLQGVWKGSKEDVEVSLHFGKSQDWEVRFLRTNRKSTLFTEPSYKATSVYLMGANEKGTPVHCGTLRRGSDGALLLRVLEHGATREDLGYRRVTDLVLTREADAPKGGDAGLRRKVDWSKPPAMSEFEGKYDPELLARLAAKPEKLNKDSGSGTNVWLLADQILRAAVEGDAQFRHLLADDRLRAADTDNRILTMSLAAYDYSVFGNKAALKVILERLERGQNEDYLTAFYLGFVDEWDQSIPAVERVFAHRDGGKGDEYHGFWAHRQWFFPESYAAFQKKQLESNKLDAASLQGVWKGSKEDVNVTLRFGKSQDWEVSFLKTNRKSALSTEPSCTATSLHLIGANEKGTPVHCGTLRRGTDGALLLHVLEHGATREDLGYRRVTGLILTNEADAPKGADAGLRREVDWSKFPTYDELANPFEPAEALRVAAAIADGSSEDVRRLMFLILQASAEKAPELQPLLKDERLSKKDDHHHSIGLALGAYDYSVNGSRKGLQFILDELAKGPAGGDVQAAVPLGFIDEWDVSMTAHEKHFAQTDGAGAESAALFWEQRMHLFPGSFEKFQMKRLAEAGLDAGSLRGTWLGTKDDVSVTLTLGQTDKLLLKSPEAETPAELSRVYHENGRAVTLMDASVNGGPRPRGRLERQADGALLLSLWPLTMEEAFPHVLGMVLSRQTDTLPPSAPDNPAADRPKTAAAKLTPEALLGAWRGTVNEEKLMLSFHRPPAEKDVQCDIYFGEATIGALAGFTIAEDGSSAEVVQHSAGGGMKFGMLIPDANGKLKLELYGRQQGQQETMLTRDPETAAIEPLPKEARELLAMWKSAAYGSEKIPGSFLWTLVTEAQAYAGANPSLDSSAKLLELLDSRITERDWTQTQVIQLLNDVAAVSDEPLKACLASERLAHGWLGTWEGKVGGRACSLWIVRRGPAVTGITMQMLYPEEAVVDDLVYNANSNRVALDLRRYNDEGKTYPFGRLESVSDTELRFVPAGTNPGGGGVILTRKIEVPPTEPQEQSARELFTLWKSTANADGSISGTFIGQLAAEVRAFGKAHAGRLHADNIVKLLPRFVTSRDWTQAEAIKLLDDVAYYSTKPIEARVAKAKLPSGPLWRTMVEFQDIPVKIGKWSEAKEGLRIGLHVVEADWRIGGKARVELWLHNAGEKDVTFKTTGPEGHDSLMAVAAIDAEGREHGIKKMRALNSALPMDCALSAGHVAMAKRFVVPFWGEENKFAAGFHDLKPGKYQLRCHWTDANPMISKPGDWTGVLTAPDFAFTLSP